MDTQLQRRADQPVATITQGFGTQEVAMRGERAAEAVAAREESMVKARFVMAIQRPRDVMDFRARLLKECQRPGFADVAMFKRPVGWQKDEKTGKLVKKYAEGPTIRMIETCLQLFRNIQATGSTVYDGPDLRVVKITVIDFENNVSFEQEINVIKQVEKREQQDYKTKEWGPPKGREILGQRINSEGDVTYLVTATDDEVIVKQAAMASKAIRTCGQRLLPRDVIEEAIAQIRATALDKTKSDPDGEKKKLLDAFAALSIMPSDLAALMGHSLDRLNPAEIEGLRDTYRTIKSGESTWDEIMSVTNTTPEPELQEEVKARLMAEAAAKQRPVKVVPVDQTERSDAAEPQAEDMGAERYEKQTDGYAPEPEPETKRRGFK